MLCYASTTPLFKWKLHCSMLCVASSLFKTTGRSEDAGAALTSVETCLCLFFGSVVLSHYFTWLFLFSVVSKLFHLPSLRVPIYHEPGIDDLSPTFHVNIIYPNIYSITLGIFHYFHVHIIILICSYFHVIGYLVSFFSLSPLLSVF